MSTFDTISLWALYLFAGAIACIMLAMLAVWLFELGVTRSIIFCMALALGVLAAHGFLIFIHGSSPL